MEDNQKDVEKEEDAEKEQEGQEEHEEEQQKEQHDEKQEGEGDPAPRLSSACMLLSLREEEETVRSTKRRVLRAPKEAVKTGQ